MPERLPKRGLSAAIWISVRASLAIAAIAAAGFALISPAGSAARVAASPTCQTPGAGVVQYFCFQPTQTAAGSNPSLTTSIQFDYAKPNQYDTVKNVTVTLAPGVLAIPTAVPDTCTPAELTAGSCPADSQVGTGTVLAGLPGFPISLALPSYSALYAMQVPSAEAGTDVAYFGLDIWLGKNPPAAGTKPLLTANAAASITPVGGQPAVQFSFQNLPGALPIGRSAISIQVDSLTLTIDGSLSNGTAFTRLPTNCQTPAITTLSVDTYGTAAAGTGSDQFTPSDCSALSFTPTLSASATRDSSGIGATFVSTINQPAGQAAQSSLTLAVPADTLAPDLLSAVQDFGSVVGSAQAVTPILSQPLAGPVTLTGTVQAPTLTITFPAPVPLTLTGTVDIADNTVTFTNLPDVPLTALTVTLNGGSLSLYAATCQTPSGSATATFVDQNGDPPVSVTDGFTVTNCPAATPLATTTTTATTTTPTTTSPVTTTPPPSKGSSGKVKPPSTAGGRITGLSGGHAQLRFSLSAGTSPVRSFTLALPAGLSFNATSYRHAIRVSGGSIASLALSHGRLSVRLRSPASAIHVTVSAQALAERSALRGRVRAHKVRTLRTSVTVATADGRTTRVGLTLHT